MSEDQRALSETVDDRAALVDRARAREREIGRYAVLSLLGEGGIGKVYLAHDPQLDRQVAIKVLRTDERPVAASEGMRERVLREARALARVVHPGIVAVYDAGFHDDALYMVMELVDGQTLRAWLDERARTRAEILDVFLQAGRGLAAAHAAGIVHRDFKPDNVLVGHDGRVRVADFGLARVLDAAAPVRAEGAGGVSVQELVTQAGALVGTPAYMAPEQHARNAAGAPADQFGFCVALYEALYGRRPFNGETYVELAHNVERGRQDPMPSGRDVPAWLRTVVQRGLSVDPAARWPSMEALVGALTADPEAARRRRLRTVGLAALVAGLGGVVTLAVVGRDDPGARCRAGATELFDVWSPAIEERVARAFAATGRAIAGDVFERIGRDLDAYSASWSAMRVEACEATRVRGTQSDAALDLRMRCLDRRREDLRAVVALLETDIDTTLLARAQLVIADLEPLSACADLDALSATVPPPADPALRAGVDEIRTGVTQAWVLMKVRRYKEGLPVAARALEEARRLGWKPLVAEAARVHAGLLSVAEDHVAAEATFREALRVAAEAHDDQTVAEAALELVNEVGHMQVRLDEAAHLSVLVETALARASAGDDTRARWATLRGNIAVLENKLPEARAAYDEALELSLRVSGPESLDVGGAFHNLCYLLRQQGAYAEALPLCERGLAIGERVLGPRHPEVGSAAGIVGIVLADVGRYEEAEQRYRRAIEIFETTLEADHPDLLLPRASLGNLLIKRGKHAEARALLEVVLAGRTRLLGAGHHQTITTQAHLGRLALATGDLDDAERRLTAAEEAMAKVFGPDNPKTAQITGQLGSVKLARKDPAEALRLFEQTLRVLTEKLGPTHRDVGRALADTALALEALGRRAEAGERMARALSILEKSLGADHPDLAEHRAALGRLGR